MKETEIIVIGAGPAGISASIESAKSGASVTLIDDKRELGGKVLRQITDDRTALFANKQERETASRLFAELKKIGGNIKIKQNTVMWGIFDEKTIAFFSENDGHTDEGQLRAKKIIIASGAFDRTIPFPGWTLPGVWTLGGLNTMVNHQRVLPGKKILVAGTGPLLLLLANNLIKAGAEVAGIVEIKSAKDYLLQAASILSGGYLLKTGIQYINNIRKNNIPVCRSHVLCAAQGEDKVSKAVINKVDKRWAPIAGTEKEFDVDAIAVGYGLIPSLELTRLFRCEHQFDENLGYWKAIHNDKMETTVPGIFVAGDGASVKGYHAAIEEGKIAGIVASSQLGYIAGAEVKKMIQARQKKSQRLQRFGSAINSFSTSKPGILNIITDDTVICRCEDVTMKTVREGVANSASDINHLKRKTRMGMGFCQGRFCGQVVNELLWRLSENPKEREIFTPRVPVYPLPFSALIE
jgi:thioredoxin reductase